MDTNISLTSRKGHTGNVIVLVGCLAGGDLDPRRGALLGAQEGRRVDHRVGTVTEAGELDLALLLHGDDAAATEGSGAANRVSTAGYATGAAARSVGATTTTTTACVTPAAAAATGVPTAIACCAAATVAAAACRRRAY